MKIEHIKNNSLRRFMIVMFLTLAPVPYMFVFIYQGLVEMVKEWKYIYKYDLPRMWKDK